MLQKYVFSLLKERILNHHPVFINELQNLLNNCLFRLEIGVIESIRFYISELTRYVEYVWWHPGIAPYLE